MREKLCDLIYQMRLMVVWSEFYMGRISWDCLERRIFGAFVKYKVGKKRLKAMRPEEITEIRRELNKVIQDAAIREDSKRYGSSAHKKINYNGNTGRTMDYSSSNIGSSLSTGKVSSGGSIKRVKSQSERKKEEAKYSHRTRSISSTKQQRILKRDNYTCRCCGMRSKIIGGTATLQVCHITPVSVGGSDDDDNLWSLCSRCALSSADSYERGIRMMI